MKTEQLIDMLARDAGPAPRAVAARRLVPAILLGLAASSLLALLVLGPLPGAAFQTPAPWIKLAYAFSLAAAAAVLTARLAKPVAQLKTPQSAVSAVVAAMVLAGLAALFLTPAEDRWKAVIGQTWLICPWFLMGLSLPALAVILLAVRGLAPIHLKRAGFASGLLAGAMGATGYALHCPESSTAFVAIWYTVGIGLTGLLGRALGPIALRW
jgi:hypothetical protein